MLLITVIFLSISLMVVGYIFRRPAITMAAGIAWLLVSLQGHYLSTEDWDIYFGVFWLGLGMTFVCFLEGFILRPKDEQQESQENYWQDEHWINERMNYIQRRQLLRKEMAISAGDYDTYDAIIDRENNKPIYFPQRRGRKQLPPPRVILED